MFSAIGQRTMELLLKKEFSELNVYNEEPKTLALYKFSEVKLFPANNGCSY